MGQATIRGGFDTFAGSVAPNATHGGAKFLPLKADQQMAYLCLKNPAPRGATIVSATLRVRARLNSTGTRTLTARRIGESWKARRLNWNNKPGVVGAARSTTVGALSDGGDVIEFDVTTHIQTATNGSPHYGWRLETDATTTHKIFGFDAGDNKPTLTVVWSDKPEAPTTLVPSAGAVSVAKPTLQFDYTDITGDDLIAVQVQIDPAGNGSSPAFDSGEHPTAVPELDLTDTAYAGLADGATTQWRVRVKDSGGLWSDYSDWASFSRDDQGTLTIDNPGAAPNDFVNEPSPPILWTLTGETQVAYQVRITAGHDRTKIRYDSGKVKSSTTAHDLPGKWNGRRILIDDRQYQVNVRTWDSKNREATPGAPVFLSAWRTFTMDTDATVPAPTLTAVQAGTTPWVDLTFTRSTAPDSWVILRDGKVIESDLDPDDVFTAGTSYSWRDYTAPPKEPHTYTVRAVVNRKASGDSNPATVTTRPEGVWIADFDRGLSFIVGGIAVDNWRMTDQASTYQPIGADTVVRITTGMTGLVGAFTGPLRDRPQAGRTLEDMKADLLAIKEQPEQTVQLVAGRWSIPVKLGDLSVSPHPDSTADAPRDLVSFQFWQDGDLPFDARL